MLDSIKKFFYKPCSRQFVKAEIDTLNVDIAHHYRQANIIKVRRDYDIARHYQAAEIAKLKRDKMFSHLEA